MAKARRVCNGVYIIGSSDISRPEDCCVYLVQAGEEAVMIDAGAGRSVGILIDNVRKLGLNSDRITYLIATHGHIDHIGGLQELKDTVGCRIAAHELELPAIGEGLSNLTADYLYGVTYHPVKVDTVLQGAQDEVEVGGLKFICLHTPGHTPGSISVYVEIDGQRVLFGQDIHGPFNKSWGSDKRQWRESMQRLLALEADILCEGHYGVYSGREKVASYIQRYLDIF